MRKDKEYKQYVNTHDKLLQELDEIRLKLSRQMYHLSPNEQIKIVQQIVKERVN